MRRLTTSVAFMLGVALGCGSEPGSGADGVLPDASERRDAESSSDSACPGREVPSGIVCGSADRPCAVTVDEVVPGSLGTREDPPSIALGCDARPGILFATAGQGTFAMRDEWGWTVEAAMPMTTGGLVTTARGALAVVGHAIGFDPGPPAELWEREGEVWHLVDDAPASAAHAGAVAMGGEALHATLVVNGTEYEDGAPELATWANGQWTMTLLGDLGRSHPILAAPAALALSPAGSGQPHVAFWENGDNDWILYHAGPGTTPRPVLSLGLNTLDWYPVALAVTADGRDDRPHVVTNRAHSKAFADADVLWSFGTEIVYLTRDGTGAWREVVVAAGDPDEYLAERCGPRADCEWDYVTFRVVAVAATSTDAHILYARYRVWSDGRGGRGIEGRLEMAVVAADGTVATQLLLEPVAPKRGTAVVDADGRIHLAIDDSVRSGSPGSVRYLRIEPAARN
jgi:hypothetical protein